MAQKIGVLNLGSFIAKFLSVISLFNAINSRMDEENRVIAIKIPDNDQVKRPSTTFDLHY